MSADWMAFWPQYLNLAGLVLDITGFILVARELLKRPILADEQPFWNEDMPPIVRALNLSGFWLVISGFLVQLFAQAVLLFRALAEGA